MCLPYLCDAGSRPLSSDVALEPVPDDDPAAEPSVPVSVPTSDVTGASGFEVLPDDEPVLPRIVVTDDSGLPAPLPDVTEVTLASGVPPIPSATMRGFAGLITADASTVR